MLKRSRKGCCGMFLCPDCHEEHRKEKLSTTYRTGRQSNGKGASESETE